MPYHVMILGGMMLFLSACAHFDNGNSGQVQSYPVPSVEAGWIRMGDPIIFENDKWFPERDVENLMDNEVYQIGEYRGVQIFVDKIDIKPYERIYTKFAKNKFRYFLRKKNDQS